MSADVINLDISRTTALEPRFSVEELRLRAERVAVEQVGFDGTLQDMTAPFLNPGYE